MLDVFVFVAQVTQVANARHQTDSLGPQFAAARSVVVHPAWCHC